jgi:FkbM family methyltransferase
MPTFRESVAASVLRRYPLASGRGTIANHRLLSKITGAGRDECWSSVPGGYKIVTPLSDYVGRSVFFFGDLDAKITALCRRIVRLGDTVLDIGANIGAVTFALAALVGPTGRVHAFEPNPRLGALLRKARERNEARQVVIHETALGAENGSLPLYVPCGNAGAASLVPERQSGEPVTVPVRRLDDVLKNVGSIRLIKIDVEGFEPQVLAGAESLFKSSRPEAVVFELNRESGPLKNNPTVAFLIQMGYSVYTIPRTFLRVSIRRADINAPTVGHDFLALRKSAQRAI